MGRGVSMAAMLVSKSNPFFSSIFALLAVCERGSGYKGSGYGNQIGIYQTPYLVDSYYFINNEIHYIMILKIEIKFN